VNEWPLIVRAEEKRLVELAVVAKKFVVVAEVVVDRFAMKPPVVPVAFLKVKFWRVVEPTTKRSPLVLMVLVAEPPMESALPVKRFEKKLVEVAEVVVALAKITFEVVRTFWSMS